MNTTPRARRALLLGLSASVLLLGSGCASLGDDLFLIKGLSPREKAEALVEAGAAAYKVRLVAKGDTGAIEEVARYFQAALRYDPANREASRYALLVEDYRAARLRAAVKEGNALLKKQKRSEAEDLALVAAARRAVELDGSDDDAKRLLRDTGPVREELVTAFLERAEAAMARATPEASAATREKAYVDAYTAASKALYVEPGQPKAYRMQVSLRSEVSDVLKSRLQGVDALVKKGAFPEARAQLGPAKDLDARLSGAFSSDIAAAEYDLYYRWAQKLAAAKDYAGAEEKADLALAAKRGSEAQALKKSLADRRSQAELGASFGAGLANVDRYIAARDLPRAQRVLAGLSRQSLDAAKKAQLNERRDALREALAEVYERGVRAYKAESFKEAIAAFEAVVAVDESYEEVASYLEKSRAKQKLLDQF